MVAERSGEQSESMQAQAESSNIIIEAEFSRTVTMVEGEKDPQFYRRDRRRNFDRAKIESDDFG